jgi:hypothetical protein
MNFGWIPEQNEVSTEDLSDYLQAGNETPDAFMINLGSEVFDQGSTSSCTAQSSIMALNFIKKKVYQFISVIITKEK